MHSNNFFTNEKLSRLEQFTSYSHTSLGQVITYLQNNVCRYSTNRVRRRPQGHQGPSTFYFFFIFRAIFFFFFFFFFFFAMEEIFRRRYEKRRVSKFFLVGDFLLTRERCIKCPRNAVKMNNNAHKHSFVLYLRVLR